MDYLTSAQQAKEWNVSQRWVSILCKQGRMLFSTLNDASFFTLNGAIPA